MTDGTADLLAIAASNGENLKLAHRFVETAEAKGARALCLDLTTVDLPVFTPRSKGRASQHVLDDLEQRLSNATRWVICAPEYNGSIPPVLSNAVAWLSVQGNDFRALFNGRPVAIASVSGGEGWSCCCHCASSSTHLGAQVVGRQMLSNSSKPARQETIDDLVNRLLQLQPLVL